MICLKCAGLACELQLEDRVVGVYRIRLNTSEAAQLKLLLFFTEPCLVGTVLLSVSVL